MCQDGATLFNHFRNIFVVFLIVLSSVCRSSFAGSRWGRYNVWSLWIKHMEVPSSIEESCSKAWWSGDLNMQCGFLPVLSNLWWARSQLPLYYNFFCDELLIHVAQSVEWSPKFTVMLYVVLSKPIWVNGYMGLHIFLVLDCFVPDWWAPPANETSVLDQARHSAAYSFTCY